MSCLFLILVLFSSLLDSFLWAIASYLLEFYFFGLLNFSDLTLFKFAMAFHHNPLLRMSATATEARVVSMLWCMLVLFGVLLVCHLYLCDPKEGPEDYTNMRIFLWNIQSLAKLLLSGVASSTKHHWPLSSLLSCATPKSTLSCKFIPSSHESWIKEVWRREDLYLSP